MTSHLSPSSGKVECENCWRAKMIGEAQWVEVAGAGEYYCPDCYERVEADRGRDPEEDR